MQLTVSHEEIENCKLKIDIEIHPESLQTEYNSVRDEYIKETVIPGFRKGKAPLSMIESQLGKAIRHKAASNLIPKAYQQAVKDNNLDTFGEPELGEMPEIEKDQPLKLQFKVDRNAECKIESFEGLEITKTEVTIGTEDVEQEVKRNLRSKASLEESPSKKTAVGQYIKFDAVFKDETFAQYSLKDYPYEIAEKQVTKPLELTEELIGLPINETKTITKSFSDSFSIKELQGKSAEIDLTIQEIKELIYPELTDEIAKELNYKSVDDMRERIKENLENYKKSYEENSEQQALLESLRKKTVFSIPESMIAYNVQRYLHQLSQQLGKEMFGSYIKNVGEEKMVEQYKESAKSNIENELMLSEVIKVKEIKAEETEIEAEIKEEAEKQQKDPETVKNEMLKNGTYQHIKPKLLNKKALAFLLDQTSVKKGEKVPISSL